MELSSGVKGRSELLAVLEVWVVLEFVRSRLRGIDDFIIRPTDRINGHHLDVSLLVLRFSLIQTV